MKRIFCIGICILVVFAATAQQTATQFPADFMGNWKGTLQWIQPGKAPQMFTMQLNIGLADSAGIYTWTIVYGDSSKDKRPYILKPVDKNKGHWVIDELNGIVLDNYVAGNCLQGSFTVMNNTIVNNYC